MALLARQPTVAQRELCSSQFKQAPLARSVRCKSYVPLELIAAAGDVDAPVAVPIVAALVVTAAVTFAVPAYLNRGQSAADKIFASKQNKPLDKGKGKVPVKGKTAAGKGKTTRR
jgi:hypothetical protein